MDKPPNEDQIAALIFTDKEWQTVIDCLRNNGEPEYAAYIEAQLQDEGGKK